MEYRYITSLDNIMEQIEKTANNVSYEALSLVADFGYVDLDNAQTKADYVYDQKERLSNLIAEFRDELEYVKERLNKKETVVF